jgi:hypothetical protein
MIMYPMHRLNNTKELNGEIEFKYKNLKNFFPSSDCVWVVDMNVIKNIQSNELCDYLLREIDYIFLNNEDKKIHFNV